MSHDSFFKQARETHDRVYPPNPEDINSDSDLTLAAAFEGMHHWEHDNRQKGDAMERDDAMASLARTVKDEATRLYFAESARWGGSPQKLDMFAIGAEDAARHLYDAYYGKAEVYDPGQVAAHDTMPGEWTAWCGDDEYRTAPQGWGGVDRMEGPF